MRKVLFREILAVLIKRTSQISRHTRKFVGRYVPIIESKSRVRIDNSDSKVILESVQ